MKINTFLGVAVGAAMLVVPAFVLAQSGNYPSLFINIQTASGSSIPSSQGTVTVNATGASLSGSPSGNNSLTYNTNFNNDSRTVTFWPSSYSVTIAPISNYAYSYSSGCNGYLNYGNNATCTITASQYGNYNNGNGTLIVYVQANNNPNCLCSNGTYNCCNNGTNYYNYSPSNFTISVSGNSPSPSSFQGSSAGTSVNIGSGYYSVNPQSMSGWTYTQSGNCSGTIYGGASYSCTITFSPTNYYQNQYPYQSGTLTCSPAYQTVALGSTVTFTAQGGNGTYTWTVPGKSYPNPNAGNQLNVVFSTPGPQTVSIVSGGQTAACSVNVTGNGYGTGYTYPNLPNTGFAPISDWQYALAAILLLGFGYAAYPYVRNAYAYLKR